MAKVNLTKNILMYALSVTSIIIALSVGYYFVIALPKFQFEKQKLESQKFEAQQATEQEKLKIEQEKAIVPTIKPKTAYDKCVEACTNRYTEAKDGCSTSQRLIYSRTYARTMCQMTEPACEAICSQTNK